MYLSSIYQSLPLTYNRPLNLQILHYNESIEQIYLYFSTIYINTILYPYSLFIANLVLYPNSFRQLWIRLINCCQQYRE